MNTHEMDMTTGPLWKKYYFFDPTDVFQPAAGIF